MAEKDQYNERWGPAKRLMSGQATPQEYQDSEISYKTDYETAMRTLSKKQQRDTKDRDK